MTQVIAVNEEDFDCQVEAGVTREQLNHHIKDTGLWFPIDPGVILINETVIYSNFIFLCILRRMHVWVAWLLRLRQVGVDLNTKTMI